MPTLIPYHLTFGSGLHVGGPRDNPAHSLGVLPADTLFAALLDAYRRSGGDPAAFAAPFMSDPLTPPFLLTSAFPFAGGVRFYPMPVDGSALLAKPVPEAYGKTVRRIAYLSEGLLRRVLAGEALDNWLFPADPGQEPTRGVALQGGRYWMSVDEIAQLPEAMRRPAGKRHALAALDVDQTSRVARVTLDRASSASQIYHVGRTVFAPGCGLWFGIHWRAPQTPLAAGTFADAVAMLLTLLGEDGIGGDRSSGYGAFHAAAQPPVTLPDAQIGAPSNGLPAAWLLSRYLPATESERAALAAPGAAYGLVTVGGRLRTPDWPAARRRKLVMLTEGSQVSLPAALAGQVADVRPHYAKDAPQFPHPVYRYGLALAVGRKEIARA
jgi:CRISPR-associated protein Csm4